MILQLIVVVSLIVAVLFVATVKITNMMITLVITICDNKALNGDDYRSGVGEEKKVKEPSKE